jgi:hypothetical protein
MPPRWDERMPTIHQVAHELGVRWPTDYARHGFTAAELLSLPKKRGA